MLNAIQLAKVAYRVLANRDWPTVVNPIAAPPSKNVMSIVPAKT